MLRAPSVFAAATAIAALTALTATAQTSAETDGSDVPGAETAPVPPTEGEAEQGSVTMTGPAVDPDTECEEGDPTCTVGTGGAVADGDDDVEGAETAPIPPTDGEQEQGTVTMTGPDADPTEEDAGNDEQSDADSPPEDNPDLVAAYEEDGRYFTDDGVPTFNVADDGTVDWLTYSGFRRYHSECHVCHGPEGEGSSYAPALKNSAINMEYGDFYAVVAGGIQNVNASENSVMPAFANNPNVMCYLDDIYVYLKARGAEVVPRGRPGSKEAKTDAIGEDEKACLGF